MLDPVLRSEAEQDRHLAEIYELLRKFAPDELRNDRIDDVVHEVTARILWKLRAGTWVYPETLDEAFIRRLLANHAKTGYRSERRRASRDGEHLRVRELTPPSWMSPDCSLGEEYLLAFTRKALEKLPDRCGEAYRLVEQECCSHAEAADRLGVSPHTICNDLVAARRALRAAAKAEGIVPPEPVVSKRTQRSRRKRKYTRFAPKYAEPVRTTPEHSPLTHAT